MKLALKYTLLVVLLILPAYAENPVLMIKNSEGANISLQVEIADTAPKRSQGLMYRKNLGINSGMLFAFPNDQYMHFWMKNTYIPLSIAFIDKDGVIFEILHMSTLDDSIIYCSGQKGRYALEVNLSWFSKNSIKSGCKILNIDGRIGK